MTSSVKEIEKRKYRLDSGIASAASSSSISSDLMSAEDWDLSVSGGQSVLNLNFEFSIYFRFLIQLTIRRRSAKIPMSWSTFNMPRHLSAEQLVASNAKDCCWFAKKQSRLRKSKKHWTWAWIRLFHTKKASICSTSRNQSASALIVAPIRASTATTISMTFNLKSRTKHKLTGRKSFLS